MEIENLEEKIDAGILPTDKKAWADSIAASVLDMIQKDIAKGKEPDIDYYKKAYKNIAKNNGGSTWGSELSKYFGQVLNDLLAKAGITNKITRQKKLDRTYNDTDLTPEELKIVVDYLPKHVTSIKFRIPAADDIDAIFNRLSEKYTSLSDDQIMDKAEKLFATFRNYKNEFLNIFPDAKEGRDFTYRNAENPADTDKHVDMWHMMAETRFNEKIENAPEPLIRLMEQAQKLSINEAKPIDEVKETTVFNSYYFALKILKIFNNDLYFYKNKKDDRTPEEVADSDDVFKQDFDSVNAYGEVVESLLREAKEEICCICGEPIEGYGNNPEPYKHEGKCCDACNMKFVIPARLADLGNKEE